MGIVCRKITILKLEINTTLLKSCIIKYLLLTSLALRRIVDVYISIKVINDTITQTKLDHW
jgi:hypothetical protein